MIGVKQLELCLNYFLLEHRQRTKSASINIKNSIKSTFQAIRKNEKDWIFHLCFFPERKNKYSNFCKIKAVKNSNKDHACTHVLASCVLPRRFFHTSNPTKKGFRVSLQTQFQIKNNGDIPRIEDTTTHNAATKMDIIDPLQQFMEIQVEIFLKLLLS